MTMPAGLRKVALIAHVSCSVGALGAVASFLALAIAGLTSHEARLIQAAYLAMELTAWFVIVPLVIAALVTGIVQSLGTSWGLFRHYWVVAKLFLTLVATVVLLLQLKLLGRLAASAAQIAGFETDILALRISPAVHATGGLLVLLAAVVLSLYKPRGLTRYGWRKQRQPSRAHSEAPQAGP